MKALLTTVLLACCGQAAAQQVIDVITMEYPPFTTQSRTDDGISFAHLQEYARQHFKTEYRPLFLPPARAQRRISSGQWCVSFFPPESHTDNARWITLAEQNIKLGLYRRQQSRPFRFQSISELSGKIAFIRSRSQSGIHKIIKESPLVIYPVEDVEQGLKMLLAGRVDYAFGDNTTLATFAHKFDTEQLQFSDNALLEGPVGFYYNTACAERLFRSPPD